MAQGVPAFCGSCGHRFTQQEGLCPSCGRPRATPVQTGRAPARTVPPAAQLSLSAVPWQAVFGDQPPDLGALLSRTAVPAIATAAGSSLRRPGIALVVTALLDLVVAATAVPSTAAGALPRVGSALLAGALAAAAGAKGGLLRRLAGVAGVLAAVVHLAAAGLSLVAVMASGEALVGQLPQLVTMASSLVLAARTALSALRRPR